MTILLGFSITLMWIFCIFCSSVYMRVKMSNENTVTKIFFILFSPIWMLCTLSVIVVWLAVKAEKDLSGGSGIE